jgi:phosphatidate cytidylyltransferase
MLRWRLLLGVSLVAALVALCWLDVRAAVPGVWLGPLAVLATVLASREVLWLLETKDLRPRPWVVYLGNFAIVLTALAVNWANELSLVDTSPMVWVLLAFAVTVMLAFLGEMWRFEKPGNAIINVALTVFALAYVGVLTSTIVGLRFLVPGGAGLVPVIFLVAVVKMGDIGAYTVGRIFGKHKMAPVLSPGKTWEGAAGAMIFAALAAVLVMGQLLPRLGDGPPPPPLWQTLCFGLAVGIAGMVGDLAESLFKRDMGRKDSSDWMPGFGGVLDIVDSLLLAAPVVYLGWLLLFG